MIALLLGKVTFSEGKMKRAASIMDTITNVVGGHFPGWLVVIMMLLVLTEVTARYVFNSPLRVADEIGAYMLIAIVFLGLGYTWKEKAHIRIEFVLNLVPRRVRTWMEYIVLIIITAVVLVFIYASYSLILTSLATGIRGYGWMRIPLVYPRLALVAGTVLLFVAMVIDLVRTTRSMARREEQAQ
ncbi:MAG: TRAP transporter small permease [Chloroflexi bacterium]|nr:TRAP transporter small permease [Chloroflexota bacterium]